jgi:asparagine synthase (glutamine-hydrolysing)
MCGIVGIANLSNGPPPSRERLMAMCDTLVHRGPDDAGVEVRDRVGIGARRLAVIDIDGGHQPIANASGTVLTVCNGEIYNYRELRRDLEARGHRFRTNSDTEVLVHGYEAFGAKFPEMLNGMFAFAVLDTRRRKLLLARDQIGIKPLYYAHVPPYFVWGSEIKALLASGLVPRELDADAAAQFMAWEYVPGEATLFRAVRKLEPGHLIELDLDDPTCRPHAYWDVPAAEDSDDIPMEAWVERLDEALQRSVKRQMVSDVPLGAFLSGGVDSSLIVSAMGPTSAFSIGFDDPSYNELSWSRQVAEHLDLKHFSQIVEPAAGDMFQHLMHYLDDPIGDFSIFPTYMVSQLARKQVTVALSGDGADELFAGYDGYRADRLARSYGRLPAVLRRGVIEPTIDTLKPRPEKKGLVNMSKRFLEGVRQNPDLCHARWRLFARDWDVLFTPEAQEAIETPVEAHIARLFDQAGDRQPLNRNLYVDVKSYLSDNILLKVDRMSMANALEARVPFLDRELVELAFRIPERFKMRGKRTKILLKELARSRLPRACVDRPKQGFSMPIKNWLSTGMRPLVQEYLDTHAIRDGGVFDADHIEQLKSDHFAGTANHSHVLWGVIVFQAWQRMWLNGSPGTV